MRTLRTGETVAGRSQAAYGGAEWQERHLRGQPCGGCWRWAPCSWSPGRAGCPVEGRGWQEPEAANQRLSAGRGAAVVVRPSRLWDTTVQTGFREPSL
ncbi:hypothetical protein NDU88_001881, partial [Pleurodeles waltl]